ncbi:MAG: alcohol dehydrogenase catalytic domain-containing protein [Armatimonadota bacterium]|nr:alcohol dehydrogenase catalytic domain-containing protein [Armatimonadota bacterium]
MRAVVASLSIPRFLAVRAVGRWLPPAALVRLSPVRLVDIPAPVPPGPDWVAVRVRLAGICGSDLHLVHQDASPSASVYASFPCVVGHENVGEVATAGPAAGVAPGQRVVVEPLLPCLPRGFDAPCPACRRGDYNLCTRFADGRLPPGFGQGFCRDVGGAWGELMVAHRSQLVPVPDALPDEQAVFAEPLACAVHAVLRHVPEHAGTVLVIGAGAMGLATVGALRALRPAVRIVAVARYPHQAALAARLGAHQVLTSRGRALYDEVAGLVGARLLQPLLGRPLVTDGADVTLECAGTSRALDDALRLTRAGGTVVCVGIAFTPRGVDWTPLYLREVRVVGTSFYATEHTGGRTVRAIELAMELLATGRVDLRPLVTHRFPLRHVGRALATALDKRGQRAVKVLLEPTG